MSQPSRETETFGSINPLNFSCLFPLLGGGSKTVSSNFFRKPTSLKLIKSSPRQNPFHISQLPPLYYVLSGCYSTNQEVFGKGAKCEANNKLNNWKQFEAQSYKALAPAHLTFPPPVLHYAEFSTHFEPKSKVKKYLVNLFPNIRTDKR